MRRTWFALLFAVAISSGVVGCGSSEPGASGTGTDTTEMTESSAAPQGASTFHE